MWLGVAQTAAGAPSDLGCDAGSGTALVLVCGLRLLAAAGHKEAAAVLLESKADPAAAHQQADKQLALTLLLLVKRRPQGGGDCAAGAQGRPCGHRPARDDRR